MIRFPTLSKLGLAGAILLMTLGGAGAQEYKQDALAAYNEIVLKQAEYKRYQTKLPVDFPLGEGALVAFLENGELRGVVVKYSGGRNGDWQEFYYRAGSPFFIFSKFYNRESSQLYRNRFYLDAGRQLQGWEVNDISQTVRGKAADLAVSRILEDSRLFSQMVMHRVEAELNPPEPAAPSIVDAMDDPENIPRAMAPDGSTLPPPTAASAAPAPDPAPAGAVAATETPSPTEANAASGPLEVEEDINPEVARWAAWANATRESKDEVTPFPAELVLGKIEVPPLPRKPEEITPQPVTEEGGPTLEPSAESSPAAIEATSEIVPSPAAAQ